MADDKPRAINTMDHIDDAGSASADAHREKPTEAVEATHVVGDALLFDKQGNIRRLPIPSNNPNDPLNYKTWEKAATIFCCCWFSKRAITLRTTWLLDQRLTTSSLRQAA